MTLTYLLYSKGRQLGLQHTCMKATRCGSQLIITPYKPVPPTPEVCLSPQIRILSVQHESSYNFYLRLQRCRQGIP